MWFAFRRVFRMSRTYKVQKTVFDSNFHPNSPEKISCFKYKQFCNKTFSKLFVWIMKFASYLPIRVYSRLFGVANQMSYFALFTLLQKHTYTRWGVLEIFRFYNEFSMKLHVFFMKWPMRIVLKDISWKSLKIIVLLSPILGHHMNI